MDDPHSSTQLPDPHFTGGIGDWLRYHGRHRADHEAVIFGERRLTYQELDARTNRAANALAGHGVQRGDRVAMLLLNGNAFIETLFACAKLGAIAVPLNYRLSPAELAFILNDAQAQTLVYHRQMRDLIDPIRGETGLRLAIVVVSAGEKAGDDADYEQTLAASPDTAPDISVTQHDPLMMMYTSGTTGRPKGALLSHANPTWITLNSLLGDLPVHREDIVLTVAPLFHIGGLAIHTLPALNIGTTVVVHAQFDPVETLRTIERERVNILFLLPAMWQAMTQVADFDDYDLSSLHTSLSGGAPCPIPVIEFFQKRGFRFLEGFGMTETTASACVLGHEDAVRKNGSVGKPLLHVQMCILDEDDREVAPGEIGELVLRGPSLFTEYWNRPDATAEAFRSGWFHSGDLARQDDEGFYYIVDRKKDMLISGGENVYPTEVEQVLYRHSDIVEVAVIGVPDDKWGEVPAAVVVPRPGASIDIDALRAHCRGQLAGFKIPKYLIEKDALPRTATGKVLKRELRTQALEDA